MCTLFNQGQHSNQKFTGNERAKKTLHKYKQDKFIFHVHYKIVQAQYQLSKYHMFSLTIKEVFDQQHTGEILDSITKRLTIAISLV